MKYLVVLLCTKSLTILGKQRDLDPRGLVIFLNGKRKPRLLCLLVNPSTLKAMRERNLKTRAEEFAGKKRRQKSSFKTITFSPYRGIVLPKSMSFRVVACKNPPPRSANHEERYGVAKLAHCDNNNINNNTDLSE